MARDTRERILGIARDLVHESSLAGVSTEDVCRAAGVHKGSLYHFFGSKDALAMAVLERNWEMMRAVLEESFAGDVPPLTRFDRFLDAFVRMLTLMRDAFGRTPACPLGALAAEMSGQGDEVSGHVARVMQGWQGYFAAAVSEAKGLGQVPGDVDARTAAIRILAHLQGLALLAKVGDDPDLVLQAKQDFRLLLRVTT